MKSLKSLFLFVLLIAPIFSWSQEGPRPYLNIQYGGPSSIQRIPGPTITTGILLTPQIGIGLYWESEPFNYLFQHGFGGQLRLATQTTEGKGWYLSAVIGRGYQVRSKSYRTFGNTDERGYLFSEFIIGRHLTPHIIFSSGVRHVRQYDDIPSRTPLSPSLGPTRLLSSKVTFVIGKPNKSSSPSLKKLNRQTYFYGLYSMNTRFFDRSRVNGMVNLGVGWKFSSSLGIGASLTLNEGLNIPGFAEGVNSDKLTGIGVHILMDKKSFLGMVELGAADQITKGRQGISRISSFQFKQHTKAVNPYSRISAGLRLNKSWIAQVSFLISPAIYGDFWATTPRNLGALTDRQEDLYFSYSDLSFGLGFML